MTIWMIWTTDGVTPNAYVQLECAWDDDSVSTNNAGWLAAVKKAETDFGGQNVRIAKTEINLNNIQASFMPVTV